MTSLQEYKAFLERRIQEAEQTLSELDTDNSEEDYYIGKSAGYQEVLNELQKLLDHLTANPSQMERLLGGENADQVLIIS